MQLLASGVAVAWAERAQQLLRDEWGVAADLWSVTSWNELNRDGLACDRASLLDPDAAQRTPWVTQKLTGRPGPVIAVSDYMRAVQDQIREWVPGDFASLGTDGWGMSDTRAALRRHFLVDAESIVVQSLATLAKRGEIGSDVVRQALAKYRLEDPRAATATSTAGSAWGEEG